MVLVSFRGFHFIFQSWRLRILAGFFPGGSSGVWESWFARLTKSEMDIVSQYILVLSVRSESSQFSRLINTELKSPQVKLSSEGRQDFSLKHILKLIVIIMRSWLSDFCIRAWILFVNRFWKSPRNCLMRFPSSCSGPCMGHQNVDLKWIFCQIFFQQRWVYSGSVENCNSGSATMLSHV